MWNDDYGDGGLPAFFDAATILTLAVIVGTPLLELLVHNELGQPQVAAPGSSSSTSTTTEMAVLPVATPSTAALPLATPSTAALPLATPVAASEAELPVATPIPAVEASKAEQV